MRFDETGEMPASEWTTRWEPSDADGAPLVPERLPLMVAVQEDRPALGDHLRELPNVTLHEVPREPFQVGEFRVVADRICHPGITVGYRIEGDGGTLAYLPDHEPALGVSRFPLSAEWTSGHLLARGADLLLHDAQYSLAEYAAHVGWGHSALDHTAGVRRLADVRHLVTFHHDPAHSDDDIDRLTAEARRSRGRRLGSRRAPRAPCSPSAAPRSGAGAGPGVRPRHLSQHGRHAVDDFNQPRM